MDAALAVARRHQEQRDLSLIMSRRIGREVHLKLSRAHTDDQSQRLRDDCEALVRTKSLSCTLDVPDAAAPLVVVVHLEGLESFVPQYYENIGQYLRAWVAAPPKVMPAVDAEPLVDPKGLLAVADSARSEAIDASQFAEPGDEGPHAG